MGCRKSSFSRLGSSEYYCRTLNQNDCKSIVVSITENWFPSQLVAVFYLSFLVIYFFSHSLFCGHTLSNWERCLLYTLCLFLQAVVLTIISVRKDEKQAKQFVGAAVVVFQNTLYCK